METGLPVQRTKEAMNRSELVKQLVEISRCCRPPMTIVKKLEGNETPIHDALHEIHILHFAEDSRGIHAYLRKD